MPQVGVGGTLAGTHDEQTITSHGRRRRRHPGEPHGPGELPPSLQVRLFGTHAFFRLWLAQVVSSLGDWIGFVALVAVAGRLGGSSPEAAIGLVMSARIIPGFFLAPVAGLLVDRWDRRRVMVACDIGRGLVLATIPFIDSIGALVLASLLLEIGTLLWAPAKEASVPNLVPTERLTTANSLSLVAAYGTFPIASLVFAGLAWLAEALGTIDALSFLEINQESLALWFDVGTFFVSAAMIATLPLARRVRADHPDRTLRQALGSAFADLAEGWRFAFVNPVVRLVLIALAAGLFGGGMLVPLGPVFAAEALGSGPAGFGLLLTALGTGVGVGIVALSALQNVGFNKVKTFCAAVLGAGTCLILAASSGSLAVAVVFVSALGVCAGAVYVLGFTILHASVDDELRGRIFGTLYTLVRLCLLLAFALGPVLSSALGRLANSTFGGRLEVLGITIPLEGVRLALWTAGLIVLGAGIAAVLSLPGGWARMRARVARITTAVAGNGNGNGEGNGRGPSAEVPADPTTGTALPGEADRKADLDLDQTSSAGPHGATPAYGAAAAARSDDEHPAA